MMGVWLVGAEAGGKATRVEHWQGHEFPETRRSVFDVECVARVKSDAQRGGEGDLAPVCTDRDNDNDAADKDIGIDMDRDTGERESMTVPSLRTVEDPRSRAVDTAVLPAVLQSSDDT